jgi:hypothetical protein
MVEDPVLFGVGFLKLHSRERIGMTMAFFFSTSFSVCAPS